MAEGDESRRDRTSTLRGALTEALIREDVDRCLYSQFLNNRTSTGGTYALMLEQLMPAPRSAKGFMSHAGGPSPACGTRIIEIWESEADSQQFFNEILTPNLPPGVVPDSTYYELHAAFTS